MRFIIIARANADPIAGSRPGDSWPSEMAAYHDTLARAGVLLDAAGLQPSATGWRLRYADGHCETLEGPHQQGCDHAAAYTVIQVRTRAEALEWARRFPAPAGPGVAAEIEVRPLYDMPLRALPKP
ncbi:MULTISPECIES: YciI family protein [Bordetella]|uniref:Dehydrogenase n=1 Tax=Bordetella genomosp. 7 TaxID=1416805 RepID=A0A261RK99_9BORD|nr:MULTISPECIES: YciI family protein [Bordetella]OZI25331.1 dehydrogenase [Bordetella genomosp. 7]